MPIGVPAVPSTYELDEDREEEDEEVEWVDIYNRLSMERILILCSELSEETSNQLVGLFVYLNAENPYKEFYFYINSPGGSVIDGLAIFDAINFVSADVYTIAAGNAFSMASLIVSTGTHGKRISLPNTRFMIHEPEGGINGSAPDVSLETKEVLRIKDLVFQLYQECTGQSLERLKNDIYRDFYLSAEEAKNYNLVDQVVQEGDIIDEMFINQKIEQNFDNGNLDDIIDILKNNKS